MSPYILPWPDMKRKEIKSNKSNNKFQNAKILKNGSFAKYF
jgi:hypothetical protein